MTTQLSTRHERFVAEYLKDGNATQAYIRAGYKPRGAQSNASKLLRQPPIAAALAAARRRVTASLEADAERIRIEYAKIAFASVNHYMTVEPGGRVVIDLDKANEAQRDGLLQVTVTEHGPQRLQRVNIRLGKMEALGALARMLGVHVAKPVDPVTDNLAEDIAAARKRVWGDGPARPPAPAPDPAPPADSEAADVQRPAADRGSPEPAPRPAGRVFGDRPAGERHPPPPQEKEWPEPGGKMPRRGTPGHRLAYNLLRSGTLSSAEALPLMLADLHNWP